MSAFINPRVGVGVFILQSGNASDPTFVMGRRHGSHGAGTWALPGGHLEFGESFEECSQREILEETGLRIKNLRFLTATNDIMKDSNRHYITIFMVCERETEEEPQRLEPEKCLEWKWVSWKEMTSWGEAQIEHDAQSSTTSEAASQPLAQRLFSPMIALLQQRAEVKPDLV